MPAKIQGCPIGRLGVILGCLHNATPPGNRTYWEPSRVLYTRGYCEESERSSGDTPVVPSLVFSGGPQVFRLGHSTLGRGLIDPKEVQASCWEPTLRWRFGAGGLSP